MKLSVRERIQVTNLLPAQGSLTVNMLVQEILGLVKFSPEQREVLGFIDIKDETGLAIGVDWNHEKAEEYGGTDIPFTKCHVEFLNQRIDAMHSEESIPQDMTDLCLRLREVARELNLKREYPEEREKEEKGK